MGFGCGFRFGLGLGFQCLESSFGSSAITHESAGDGMNGHTWSLSIPSFAT